MNSFSRDHFIFAGALIVALAIVYAFFSGNQQPSDRLAKAKIRAQQLGLVLTEKNFSQFGEPSGKEVLGRTPSSGRCPIFS